MLKGEQKSQILDLMSQDSFKSLLALITSLTEVHEKRAANMRIEVGKENNVLYEKARAEGARSLQKSILYELSRLKTAK